MSHLRSFLRRPLYLLLLVLAFPIAAREATASSSLDCESMCSNLGRIVYEEAMADGHTPEWARYKARGAKKRCEKKHCGLW